MIKVLSREADKSMLGFSREVARAYGVKTSQYPHNSSWPIQYVKPIEDHTVTQLLCPAQYEIPISSNPPPPHSLPPNAILQRKEEGASIPSRVPRKTICSANYSQPPTISQKILPTKKKTSAQYFSLEEEVAYSFCVIKQAFSTWSEFRVGGKERDRQRR